MPEGEKRKRGTVRTHAEATSGHVQTGRNLLREPLALTTALSIYSQSTSEQLLKQVSSRFMPATPLLLGGSVIQPHLLNSRDESTRMFTTHPSPDTQAYAVCSDTAIWTLLCFKAEREARVRFSTVSYL
jgi:hypothetical protein